MKKTFFIQIIFIHLLKLIYIIKHLIFASKFKKKFIQKEKHKLK